MCYDMFTNISLCYDMSTQDQGRVKSLGLKALTGLEVLVSDGESTGPEVTCSVRDSWGDRVTCAAQARGHGPATTCQKKPLPHYGKTPLLQPAEPRWPKAGALRCPLTILALSLMGSPKMCFLCLNPCPMRKILSSPGSKNVSKTFTLTKNVCWDVSLKGLRKCV